MCKMKTYSVLNISILKMKRYTDNNNLPIVNVLGPSYDRDEYVDRDSFWIHLINEDDLIKLRAFAIVQVSLMPMSHNLRPIFQKKCRWNLLVDKYHSRIYYEQAPYIKIFDLN